MQNENLNLIYWYILMYLTGSSYRLTILLDDVRYTAELENYQSFEFMDYRRNIELGVCICSKFQSMWCHIFPFCLQSFLEIWVPCLLLFWFDAKYQITSDENSCNVC